MQQIEEEWFTAVCTGNEKRVAELLAKQPKLIDLEDQRKRTALQYATQAGHEAVVARLLAAQPASRVDISFYLLQASAKGYGKVVDLLLTTRNPDFTISGGQTAQIALYHMITMGDQRASLLLAVCPSLIDASNAFGTTPLHLAASSGHNNLVSQLLALRPQMIDVVDRKSHNALMCAVQKGHQAAAETLLAIKPELIFNVSSEGNTVLHYAVEECKDPEFVAKLWRMNPQALTHANRYSRTPFHWALEPMRNELIELFQWSLSFDCIMRALILYQIDYQEKYRPVMERLCESLFVSLNQDVAGIVLEYVGIKNKRAKLP